MKKYTHCIIGIWIIATLALALTGCACTKASDPYLVDRTEGWQANTTLVLSYKPSDLDAEYSKVWNELLNFVPYSFQGELSQQTFQQAAIEAIRLNFGESAANTIGNHDVNVKSEKGTGIKEVLYSLSDEYIIVFDANTGRLKFCADLRNSEMLNSYSGSDFDVLLLSINIASLSPAALKELQGSADCIDFSSVDYPEPDANSLSLPLTAKGAYDLSVGMDVKHWHGSSHRFSATGGAFAVYRSLDGESLIVITNTYTSI